MATAVSAPGERHESEGKANNGFVSSNRPFGAVVKGWLNDWRDVWHFDPELDSSPTQSEASTAVQMSHAHSDPLPVNQVLAAEYKSILRDDFIPSPIPGADPRLDLPAGRPLRALCISGGGIRSATFALGALQALAEKRLLQTFDYLSTVSGGGYTGSWLTSWIQRAGREKVFTELQPDAPAPPEGATDPIGHLREYNNYLSPELGLFSADTWALVATIGRNIILNWFVLVPLTVVVLIIPRLLIAVARLGELLRITTGTTAPVSTSPIVFPGLLIATAALMAFALFRFMRCLPGVGEVNSTQTEFARWILAPSITGTMTFTAFECLYFWGDRPIPSPWIQQVEWLMSPLLVAWVAFVLSCGLPWRKRRRFVLGPLPVAFLMMGVSMGTGTWLLTEYILPRFSWELFVTVTPPLLMEFLELATVVFIGLSSRQLQDKDREWFSRSSGMFQVFCLAWVVGCGIVLLAPAWILDWHSVWGPSTVAAIGTVAGWLSRFTGKGGLTFSRIVAIAPLVFVIALFIALSIGLNVVLVHLDLLYIPAGHPPITWSQHYEVLEHTTWTACLEMILALFAFGLVMGRFVNINTFSLNGMYRNRLIRAYLGASNPRREDVNRFTGFAESDNMQMSALRDVRPFHVVNTSLNLVSGKRLAWQQRKAQSFTMTPLHCGNYELGYRDSAKYGGPRGISLGGAIAISGAAASPNMGYHSSVLGAIVMTLFNARLGAWLGNPGKVGNTAWTHSGPRSAVAALTREALSLTNNESPYISLSDGGHFENLGIYEMVLRRCRTIFVLDGGCDPNRQLEDLGNALRKIRIDLRVPIEFDDNQIERIQQEKSRYAVARIRYSSHEDGGPDGVLVYLKATLIGNEPPDVSSYKKLHPEFPHETTADQFFNESQTESYRMLGLQTIRELCEDWRGGEIEALCEQVARIS
jgi:hypothetical protein